MALATSPIALAFQSQQRRRRRRLRRPPVWLHPRQIERSYARALELETAKFIRHAREVILRALASISAQANSELGLTRRDAFPDRVEELLAILRIGTTARDASVKALAVDIGQRTSAWNNKEWQKTLRKTVGVGIFTAEPALRERLGLFATTNEKWFKGMQEDTLAKLDGILERGFSTGARHETIAKEIEKELGKTKARARLTARDQVSKLNGRLTEMRQLEAGVTKYIWRTSEDSRVRPATQAVAERTEGSWHRPMNGKLGRWDDASLYANRSEPNKWLARSSINAVELHPGQDILCRCFAEPFIEELAEEEAA